MADDVLLQVRDVLQRTVDAEVATGNHHGVGRSGDAGQVGERRARLDLGDDAGTVANNLPQRGHVGGAADERQGDELDAGCGDGIRQDEVTLGRGKHLQPLAHHVHTG